MRRLFYQLYRLKKTIYIKPIRHLVILIIEQASFYCYNEAMKNETNMKNTLMNTTKEPPLGTVVSHNVKSPLGIKKRLLSYGLVLMCVLLALLLAVFIAVSAVVLESHTYKRAARDEAYLSGVESAAVDIMKEAAKENGLSKTMLMKHVQRDDIHKLAKKNAADAALVLKGSQVIYGESFNTAALETDIYKFYEMRLPEPEVKEDSTVQNDAGEASVENPETTPSEANTPEGADVQQEVDIAATTTQQTEPSEKSSQSPPETSNDTINPIYAQDTAPLLGKTEEDPEREALRERADELATEIGAQIDTAVRVIDMEQVIYNYSDGSLIDWFRFMGRGGVLLPLVLLAVMLLLLYRQVWQRGFSPWLAAISISSGVALLICAAIIPVMGWMNLSIEPVPLNILCESIVHGLLAELLVMAVLWFVVSYIAVRAAIGRPVSIKWIQTMVTKLRKAPDETAEADGEDLSTTDPEDNEVPENTTVHAKSPINNDNLLQTIKKAAADSTNSLLGRKGR